MVLKEKVARKGKKNKNTTNERKNVVVDKNDPVVSSLIQNKSLAIIHRREAGVNWRNMLDRSMLHNNEKQNETQMRAERKQQPQSQSQSQSQSTSSDEKNSRGYNDDNMIASNVLPAAEKSAHPSKAARQRQRRKLALRNQYLALDCEMVGIGPDGKDNMLARVSIVNKIGEILLDKYVKPREEVTDYRTFISGIRPEDIENACEFSLVQNEVVQLLKDKILIGHSLRNDLAVLSIEHPKTRLRDTSLYKPFWHIIGKGRTPSLKHLTRALLGIDIQTGEHDSVQDARAAMSIYNHISSDWEKYIERRLHRGKH